MEGMTKLGQQNGAAAIDQRGAGLYNGYHFLTLVAGLYQQIAFHDSRGAGQIYDELTGTVLDDLGVLYGIWERVQKDAKGEVVGQEDAALGAVIARACARAARLVGLLGPWTPSIKWLEALWLCERRWQRILTELRRSHPALGPDLGRVLQGAQTRGSRLTGRLEAVRREALRMRLNSGFLASGTRKASA
jgi:hypothetical protein